MPMYNEPGVTYNKAGTTYNGIIGVLVTWIMRARRRHRR